MRTKLLAGVAMAALIGCTTLAVAQEGAKEAPGKTTVAPKGGPGGASPGGAMQHTQPAPGGAAQNPGGAAQNQAIPEKQGMGPPKGAVQNEERNAPQRGAEEKNNAPMQRGAEQNEPGKGNANDNNAQNQRGGGTNEHNAAQNDHNGAPKASGGKSVQLSDNQRTQIKTVIVKDRNVARVNNVNFNITVGTAVPREVHIAVLPAEVVTIVPEYAGYEYIIVGDQLLIIDPNTLEIVAILPA
jgi:hypothetical protein